MKERRKLDRFVLSVGAKIEVKTPAETGETLDLTASNICAGGAFFPTNQILPEGTDVSLDLRLPLDRLKDLIDFERVNVRVDGRVLRCAPTGMAISFNRNYEIMPF